jgi:hypothetical protein
MQKIVPSLNHSLSGIGLALEELIRLDEQRVGLASNARRQGRYLMCHWQGSIMPVMLYSPQVWFDLVLYTVVSLLASELDKNPFPTLDPAVIGVVGTVQAFFLTFFVSQSYSRMQGQFWVSKSCEGRINDIAALGRSCLPREHAQRLVRYANAAHLLAYLGLSDVYNGDNVLTQYNTKHNILSASEVERLHVLSVDGGGAAYKEVIAWLMIEVTNSVDKHCTPNYMLGMEFRKQIMRLRGALGTLYDYADFPVPFFYVHFVYCITGTYLTLFSYSMALECAGENILVGYVLVIVNTAFVVGLRHIGRKFADPYGNDIEDYPVLLCMAGTLRGSRGILQAVTPGTVDAAMEERMATGKPTSAPTETLS